MNKEQLTTLFNLGRKVNSDSNFPYIHIAFKYGLNNYRLITFAELYIRGKGLDIPLYVQQFMQFNDEAIMIANIIDNYVISITFRTIKGNKEFIKLGNTKSMLYGLGYISEDFRYGNPLILVEGHLDRDMMSLIYKDSLGIMTNRLSTTQIQLLTNLTNKFILMLDNDEPGISGQNKIEHQLKRLGCKVYKINHNNKLKDAGDLVRLEITNRRLYNEIIEDYKNQINFFGGG